MDCCNALCNFKLGRDIGADCVLRYGLWWSIIGHLCSMRSALWSLVVYYRTFVQYDFCVIVYGGLLSDISAVWFLRYSLWLFIIGHLCRLRSALWPLVGALIAYVKKRNRRLDILSDYTRKFRVSMLILQHSEALL